MEDSMWWDAPPISRDDQALIDAYVEVGRPLDDLAYSDDFEKIAKSVGVDPNNKGQLHGLYKRLIALRKMAILPNLPLRYAAGKQATG